MQGISPPLLKLLNEQVPQLNGNKLTIQVRNEMEGLAIKRKYANLITDAYQYFGFPAMSLDTEIAAEKSNSDYEQFLLAKQKEDEERGKQALLDIQKMEAEKEAGDSPIPSGPLTIGLTIKDDSDYRRMEEIVDEERRVTIQGYVFFAETKRAAQWTNAINL